MRDTPTAEQVLEFIDEFAGQEDDASEVRDFVQLAARFLADGESPEMWEEEPILQGFCGWLGEKRQNQEKSELDLLGRLRWLSVSLGEGQAEDESDPLKLLDRVERGVANLRGGRS